MDLFFDVIGTDRDVEMSEKCVRFSQIMTDLQQTASSFSSISPLFMSQAIGKSPDSIFTPVFFSSN